MDNSADKHPATRVPSRRPAMQQRDLVIQSLIRCPAGPARGRS